MRVFLILIIVSAFVFGKSQNAAFPIHLQKTMLAQLESGDSLVYYQCHVDEVTQQLSTTSGQTLQTAPQKYSITEKFVVKKDSASYTVNYYVSSMIVLPNRKFSGLKIRERDYWNFKRVKEGMVTDQQLKILSALELKGKEPTEYDFVINKYNTNQVIIKKAKAYKQLVIDGDYLLSKIIFDSKL